MCSHELRLYSPVTNEKKIQPLYMCEYMLGDVFAGVYLNVWFPRQNSVLKKQKNIHVYNLNKTCMLLGKRSLFRDVRTAFTV